MSRRWELDWLRGFMLVMMFCTHLSTRFSNPLGQPFGFVSAAEGFVMLSGFMAGMVYTGRAQKDGIPAMRKAFFKRALTIYACHAFLLVFGFSIIAALGLSLNEPALTGLLGYYLSYPWVALPGALLLIYDPPLLDILPLYILLLLGSPFVLSWGIKRGWSAIFIASSVLWLGAQFGLSEWLYRLLVGATDLQVPYKETGAFESHAWQFLWILGMWMGANTAQGALTDRQPFPLQLVVCALIFAAVCLVWRHVAGQVPMPGEGGHLLNRLFDKWHLGPLRLLNFLALLVLILHFGERLARYLPRSAFLEKLGAASLPVFCMHLVVVLLALSFAGTYKPERALWIDVTLLAGGFFILYLTAEITLYLDREERARLVAAREAKRQKKESMRLAKKAAGSG